MILREARAGLPKRTMRLFIDGDEHRGPNNAAVVIPPGVAHAIRVEGSEDLIMVYGTSTSFQAEFEGRIASEVETASLPESWQKFLSSDRYVPRGRPTPRFAERSGYRREMKRRFDPAEPELMDRPQPVSAELESDLQNLRALNRYFGSYRLVRYFLRRWIKRGDKLRVLDLATGSGDIPRLVVDFARKVGARVEVDAVDFQASTLEIARQSERGLFRSSISWRRHSTVRSSSVLRHRVLFARAASLH